MVSRGSRNGRGTVFPIVEAYGFPYDSDSPLAARTWNEKTCPFAGRPCEKQRQYGFGYCSVTYAAQWDNGNQHTYAVCDHRLDGPPIQWAIADYFEGREAILVPEVTATTSPKRNIDYVAFRDDPSALNGASLIAIEAQTIDLRGGGVGPAWKAWEEGNTANWREYFTAEAERKGRRDTVDYGVNTGNVYKRLGTQVAEKSVYLKEIEVPLYVVMQYSILRQLRSRINFSVTQEEDPWDITFAGFEYDGSLDSDGILQLNLVEVVRTTVPEYLHAMTTSRESRGLRRDFIERVKTKAKLNVNPAQSGLF
ncbi:NotI family restriction endonuclease [Nonomuraea sp. SYSU D8015]|uniref:NotI family restriction endonuclease n=1 Tax=Nonomuraea sp. SYSU D8015 TaxID=2593644 RepID=UPI001660ED63|nr:NotI family restriction endonuclease [Nonomuraea sp. SYSU D8015]